MLFLSIDFGTSAVKMSLMDEKLETKCWSKEAYHYQIFPGEKNELREADLFRAFYGAASRLNQDLLKKVEMVCYDTFSPSPVFLDQDGSLVYPNIITHLDRRSRAQMEYIDRVFGSRRYMEIAGIYPFPGGCSAMTLLWMRQNMPDILDKTYAVGHLPTYIHKKLTGKWMVDFVNASMIGMYETTTQGGWSEELIREFGLRKDLFGEIYSPGMVHGTLVEEVAHRLGVPAGIPVCVGTNDVAAAQMGAGNRTAGEIMNTTGSSEMVSILTDRPKTSPDYYLRNAALPGLWQIYVTTCGGFGVDWFYSQFCQDLSQEEFYAFEERAIEQYLQSGQLEVTFDPYLSGDRQSLEKRTGAWHGLTLATKREDLLVAYLIGIQQVMTAAIDRAEQVTKLKKTVKISGGMATESYLRLKERFYQGMAFEVVDDCPIRGNVELAKYYM